MAKLYDLVIKVGTYTNNQNEEKGRYKNVGVVMEGQQGGMFLLLDRTFNPAGHGEGESCLISMFEPKQRGQQGTQNQNQGGQGGGAQQQPQQQYNQQQQKAYQPPTRQEAFPQEDAAEEGDIPF